MLGPYPLWSKEALEGTGRRGSLAAASSEPTNEFEALQEEKTRNGI
jgi:hypothetical protein